MDGLRRRSPFLASVREAIRVRHFSIRTEGVYVGWIRRFILFQRKRHPRDKGEVEVQAFLNHLAVHGQVSPSTQSQALNALDGQHWLIDCLLYGSGLRLMEAVRPRVKGLDFGHRAIVVRDGKGGKDRVVTLPVEPGPPLRRHLEARRTVFERDVANGHGSIWLPHALARKYPRAPAEWGWQHVFPASRVGGDPRSGRVGRHRIHESAVQPGTISAQYAALLRPTSWLGGGWVGEKDNAVEEGW